MLMHHFQTLDLSPTSPSAPEAETLYILLFPQNTRLSIRFPPPLTVVAYLKVAVDNFIRIDLYLVVGDL